MTSEAMPATVGNPPAARRRLRISPRSVGLVVLLVALALAARGCQHAQVRISQQAAVAKARAQVHFHVTRMQVRFVRQGLGSRPFWGVSLSNGPRIVVVRIDANTGVVSSVKREAQ